MTRKHGPSTTNGQPTISDQIRALHAEGATRAQIAKRLNRSYQQVRQVLIQDEARQARTGEAPLSAGDGPARREPAASTQAADAGAIYRLELQLDGSIRLPLAVEHALGLARGGVVVAEFQDDRLVLLSAKSAMRRAQDLVRALIPGSDSLAQSLIDDRRLEVERG